MSHPLQTLLDLAWAHRRKEEYQAAAGCLARARALAQADDHAVHARIEHIGGQLEADQGRPEDALDFAVRALDHARRGEVAGAVAHAQRHVADLKRELGRHAEAVRDYAAALAAYRADPAVDERHLANAQRGHALTLAALGQTAAAATCWREARAIYAAHGIDAGVAEADAHLAELG